VNQGVSVENIRRNGALYVAESRIRQMSKWKGIITLVAVGNPLFYLVAIGIGIGILVTENSGTSGTGGVEYIVFIAPALLANTALLGAMDETVFPVMEGFKWRKMFYAINSTPVTGPQIALGVFLAALVRVAFSVFLYWIFLVAFGVLSFQDSWMSILVAMYGGAAFGALMMGVVAGVQKDDYFLTVLGRLVITPLFLFSGTFFPLTNMPIYLQPIGWISPLWHTTELGRYFGYGAEVPGVMLSVHFLFLTAMLVVGIKISNIRFTNRLLK
jgi:lipooligosaccharide transport system permease protein